MTLRLSLYRYRYFWLAIPVIATALYLLHTPILVGVASFMTIRDSLDQADLILPLYHEAQTVPFAAAALYHLGYANRVALGQLRMGRLEMLGLRPPLQQIWRGVLEHEGVPPGAIVTIGQEGQNAVELAQAVASFLGDHKQSRIIVVVSAPLSRISRDDFRHGLTGSSVEARIYPVPQKEFNERTWWRSTHGWVSYFDVYYLWLLRFLRH